MLPRLLSALVDLACRRARATIGAALLLAAVALVYTAGHVRMSSDATELIAADVPWRLAERRMDAAFPGNGDTILAVIDGATPELAEDAAARLTAMLATDRAHFAGVSRPDGGAYFARQGLLFADVAGVRATTARMIEAQPFLGPLAADPSLRGIAGALDTMLEGVARGEARLARLEPALGRLADALERQASGQPAFFSWQALLGGGGAMRAPTRRLVLVHPRLDLAALTPGAEATQAIRAAVLRLQLDPAHGVRLRLTGSVPLSDEEFASLAEKWWLVAGAMVAAMLGTLWLATRSARITGAILVTTMLGLIVTTGGGLMLVGRLNLISVAFVPLFVGLGVDFGIQLAVRFQAERHEGLDPHAAIAGAARALGPSLLLAAGAVCLGFLAFLPTAYRGIAELGLIASLGMAVALLFSLTVLPALLMLLKPARPCAEVGTPALARADAFLLRRRRLVLGLFAASLALSVALLPFVRFDFNPLHLRATDGEAMATLGDLMRDPDRNPNVVDILAPDIGAAQRLGERVGRLREVGQVVTAASFVPADQPEKLAAIADARLLLDLTLDPIAPLPPPTDAESRAALAATARSLAAASRTDPGQPGRDAARLARQFARLAQASPAERQRAAAMLVPPLRQMLGGVRDALQAAPVDLAGLPAELRRDWIAADGRARVQVTPAPGFTDNAGLARFTRAVLAIAPDATGVAVSTQGAARTIAGAFIQAGLLALLIVFVLLYATLRSAKEVAFTLAPVVLSGFLTLGTCVLIGLRINFANIIAFPLLFGVGVAFHIYFVMAWRSGATDLLQSSLARAIFFSAMATGTAFGSLWLSHHPGTASMGQVLMLSLVWTLVCALLFEPALLGPPRSGGEGKAEQPIL